MSPADSKNASNNPGYDERVSRLFDLVDAAVREADTEKAISLLQQLAELTHYQRFDVLKLLSRAFQQNKQPLQAAILWLQACSRFLHSGQLQEASNSFVRAFSSDFHADLNGYYQHFYPFARCVLRNLGTALQTIADSHEEAEPFDALILVTGAHSQQYRRLAAVLGNSGSSNVAVLTPFSLADEMYQPPLYPAILSELSKGGVRVLRPSGETTAYDRIRFLLQQMAASPAFFVEPLACSPEGLLMPVASTGPCAIGLVHGNRPLTDGLDVILGDEQACACAPATGHLLSPVLKNADPQYPQLASRTNKVLHVVIAFVADQPYAAEWLQPLHFIMRAHPEVSFVLCPQTGAEKELRQSGLSEMSNSITLAISDLHSLAYRDCALAILPTPCVPATVFGDLLHAGTYLYILSDSTEADLLAYPSFARNAVCLFSVAAADHFQQRAAEYLQDEPLQKQRSLLATTLATRGSFEATSALIDTVLAEAAGRISEKNQVVPPTDTQIAPATGSSRANLLPAGPAVTAIFAANLNHRILDILLAMVSPETQDEVVFITENTATCHTALPVVVIEDRSGRSKYSGQSERALIDFLQQKYSAQRLLFAGITDFRRMAEINERVLRLPYSIIVRETEFLPAGEPADNDIDALQNFLAQALWVYSSGSRADRLLAGLGFEPTRAERLRLTPSEHAYFPEKSGEQCRIGILATPSILEELTTGGLALTDSSPVCYFVWGREDDVADTTGQVSRARSVYTVAASELQQLGIAVIYTGSDEEPLLPALEFFLQQIAAYRVPVLTDNKQIIAVFEQRCTDAPITVFNSKEQLEKQLSGLLSDENARQNLAEMQYEALHHTSVEPEEQALASSDVTQSESGTGVSVLEKARSFLHSGNTERALEIINRALSTDHDNPGLLIVKAEALLTLGEYATAEHAIKRALAIFPENSRAVDVLGRIRARENTQSRPAREATDPLEADGATLVDTALSLLKDNRAQESLDLLLKHKIEPTPRDYYHTLALCHAKMQDYTRSLTAVQHELELFPDNGPAQALKKSLSQMQ